MWTVSQELITVCRAVVGHGHDNFLFPTAAYMTRAKRSLIVTSSNERENRVGGGDVDDINLK